MAGFCFLPCLFALQEGVGSSAEGGGDALSPGMMTSGLTFVESHRESHLRKHEKVAGGGAD